MNVEELVNELQAQRAENQRLGRDFVGAPYKAQ